MTSILQSSIRPHLGSLARSIPPPSRLLGRASQSVARAGKLRRKELVSPVLKRPLWSPRRSINHYYSPESFWARNKPQIVVGGVIGLCCGVHFCRWTAGKLSDQGDPRYVDLIQRNLINSVENIKEGRWWVMFTSSVVHGGIIHLSFNMAALWAWGPVIVTITGVTGFVGLWVASAAASAIAQNWWHLTQERLGGQTVGRRWDKQEDPTILGFRISRERALAISGGRGALGPSIGGSVGASGALCGLLATCMCFMPKIMVGLFGVSMPLWLSEIVFTAGSVFCMATGSLSFIGHAGHLGGTAAGIAYYYGALRPWLRKMGRL